MTDPWRHSTDDMDRIRMNADRLHAQLTDYAPTVPSALAKCIYLTEAEAVLGPLRPEVMRELASLRAIIASACGIR